MLSFTERAREKVLAFMADGDGQLEALRVFMDGSPLAPSFELTLVPWDERRDTEREVVGGGFKVLVDENQVDALDGATVDFVERVNESGFEVRTTAAGPSGANGGERAVPTGEIADRVQDVLEAEVNPAIAAHGGMITLVDVKDHEIFLEMSGGCQGCAMSRLTLQQGVERMLRQAVPEITAVHDVTDHDSGVNPYYGGSA